MQQRIVPTDDIYKYQIIDQLKILDFLFFFYFNKHNSAPNLCIISDAEFS